VIVRLEATTIVSHTTTHRVRTRTRMRQGLLGYVVFGGRTCGTVNGLSVRPGLMLAAAPDAEAWFVTGNGWESITFVLPPEFMLAHMTARGRGPEFHAPQGVETLQVDPQTVRALFDWGRRLVDTAVAQPELFDEGRLERSAAQVELVEALLATLGTASDFHPTRGDRTRQGQSRIVKVAEDHALSRIGDHLYVTDLCKAAAVSERRLEYAFKEVMGLTPMTYLMRLRLHRVREGLLAAKPGSTTVSNEALRWGFWHFGEFSRAYRDCFGELPSETLRRGRVAPPP
jgi:AraC-like DNA-binding protein